MATKATATNGQVHYLTTEEGRELFDRQARRSLKMRGDEFVQRWDAGALDENPDRPEVRRVAMLLPLGRKNAH